MRHKIRELQLWRKLKRAKSISERAKIELQMRLLEISSDKMPRDVQGQLKKEGVIK